MTGGTSETDFAVVEYNNSRFHQCCTAAAAAADDDDDDDDDDDSHASCDEAFACSQA